MRVFKSLRGVAYGIKETVTGIFPHSVREMDRTLAKIVLCVAILIAFVAVTWMIICVIAAMLVFLAFTEESLTRRLKKRFH